MNKRREVCVCLSFANDEKVILTWRCDRYFLSSSHVQAEDPEKREGSACPQGGKKAMVNLFSFMVASHSAVTVATVTTLSATV